MSFSDYLTTEQIEAAIALCQQRRARPDPSPEPPAPTNPRGTLARLYPATQDGLEALRRAVDAAGSPGRLGEELGYGPHAAYRAVCNRHKTICRALGQWDLPSP